MKNSSMSRISSLEVLVGKHVALGKATTRELLEDLQQELRGLLDRPDELWRYAASELLLLGALTREGFTVTRLLDLMEHLHETQRDEARRSEVASWRTAR